MKYQRRQQALTRTFIVCTDCLMHFVQQQYRSISLVSFAETASHKLDWVESNYVKCLPPRAWSGKEAESQVLRRIPDLIPFGTVSLPKKRKQTSSQFPSKYLQCVPKACKKLICWHNIALFCTESSPNFGHMKLIYETLAADAQHS